MIRQDFLLGAHLGFGFGVGLHSLGFLPLELAFALLVANMLVISLLAIETR